MLVTLVIVIFSFLFGLCVLLPPTGYCMKSGCCASLKVLRATVEIVVYRRAGRGRPGASNGTLKWCLDDFECFFRIYAQDLRTALTLDVGCRHRFC